MSEENTGCNCIGCGFSIMISIVVIMFFWALFVGLPVGKSIWNIDVFPPRVYDSTDTSQANIE